MKKLTSLNLDINKNLYSKCKKKLFGKRIEGKGQEEMRICPIHVYFIIGKKCVH